jgi:hypothetical protein
MLQKRVRLKESLGERRRTTRFDLALPIHIVKLSEMEVDYEGETRDLSSAGAYFVVNGEISRGSNIEFFVTLRKRDGVYLDHDVQLRCRGRVVRAETLGEEGDSAVAATIDRYQFVR